MVNFYKGVKILYSVNIIWLAAVHRAIINAAARLTTGARRWPRHAVTERLPTCTLVVCTWTNYIQVVRSVCTVQRHATYKKKSISLSLKSLHDVDCGHLHVLLLPQLAGLPLTWISMDKSMDISMDISKSFKLNCHMTSVISMHWKLFSKAGMLLTKQWRECRMR